MAALPIIDGDGHILEDASGISKHLPWPYNGRREYAMFHLFPPLDHLHGQPFETPHSSGRARKSIETGKAAVNPQEWRRSWRRWASPWSSMPPSHRIALDRPIDKASITEITMGHEWRGQSEPET